MITAENLSVSSSLEPPVSDENDLSDANHLSDANDVNDDDEDAYEGSPSNNQLLIDSSHKGNKIWFIVGLSIPINPISGGGQNQTYDPIMASQI